MSDTTQTDQPSLDLQTPFTSSLNNFEDAPQAPQLYNINIASDPERAKFRDAFADKNNNGGLTPNVISQAPADENPQEYRDLGMNIKALSLFTGQAPEDIAQNYEYQKQKFIKENNLDMPNNEGQFRSTLGNQFRVADEQSTAIDEARNKALQDDMEDADAGMNKSMLSRYQEWNTQHAGSFVGVPESQKMNAFMQAYIPARHAVQSPYGQLAKEIVQNFQNDNPTDDIANKAKGAVRQVQNALGVDMSNPDAESTIRPVTHSSEVADRLADKLAEVPSQDIPKVRALVRAYAKLSNKGDGDSPMAAVTYRLAQQIGRPVSGLLPKIKDTIKLQPLQDYLDLHKSLPEQDQNKNYIAKLERQIRNLKMRSVLRSIANEEVNPIKSNWWGEKAIGEVSGAASYVLAFRFGAAAGEAYMMGSSMVDYQDRQIAQNPDIDLKEIEAKVSSVGVMSAALQLVGMGTVAKAFPATEVAINTLALDRPVLNAVLHGTVSTGAMTGSQFMDLAGDIASTALDKDFGKDRDFSKEALDTLIHTPTTFAVMMLLGGIAHDKLTPEQIQEQIAYLRDPIAARAAGMDKNLFIGKTDAEIPATYRAAWSTRDVEAGKAFRAKLQELATNPENDPTLPRTHIDPQTGEHVVTILDPINGNIHELVRTNDAEEAGKVFSLASGFERIHLLQSFAMEQRIRENAAKNGIDGINFKYNFSNQLGTANKLSGFESLPDDVQNRILTAELPYGSDAVKAMVEGWQATTPISEDLRNDISKYVTQITNAKGTPDINLHESLDAWTSRLLQSGQISADQFKDWVAATEAVVSARSGSPVEFMPNKVDPTDREVIEAVTKAGMHLFGGHTADFASYPPDLQGYFMSMASYFRDVQEIGQHVKQAVDAGEIPKDFSEYLANALGLPAETRLAPKSDQKLVDTVNPPLEAAGQPTFSIRAGEPDAEPKPEKDSIYHPDESTESGSDAPSTPLEDLDPSKQTGEEWQKIPWSPETSYSIRSLPTAYPDMSKEIYDQISQDTEHVYGMWIDRMRVGDYKGIPLQGGMFYPTILENLEKGIVWAYNAEGVANGELNKASTTGGYMKLMLMQEGNVIGNKTFAHCWFHDLQENIDAGKLTKKQALAELNRIRELFAEHANSKIRTDHTTPWKTLEQAKKDIVDMPQQKRGSTYFQKSKTVTKSEGEKIAYQSLLSQKMTKAGFPDAVQMVRDIEEPSFKGLPVGSISGIIKLHPDQTPMTAAEAGVPEHLSYGYVLKGEPIARMTNFRNVKDLFPEIPDYPLNWSTTPLDVERGLATTFSLRARDEAYDAAVKSGDEAEQQRLVDEALYDAGYYTNFYHGSTNKEINRFNSLHRGRGFRDAIGTWMALGDKETAAQWTGSSENNPNGRVYRLAIPRNLNIERKFGNDEFIEFMDEVLKKAQEYMPSLTAGTSMPAEVMEKVRKQYLDQGIDGFVFKGLKDSLNDPNKANDSYVIFKEDEIKSADPITRDEAGNVIPLSERFNPNDNRITYSIRSAEDRQKFQDEIDKRIHSDPEVYIPIWEKMREKVKQVQDTIDAFSRADSRDVTGTLEEKYREQGLIEINAVINALPKEIRAEFIRNWRNPYSGEQGNIFTKYSSLTTDAERTDMLVKTVRKAKEALDDALVNDFSTRHQKLLDKSAPKMKAGEKPKGKLGADTHAILADIQRYSHMDLAEVDSHVQSLQAEKDKLENGEGTIDEDARQAKIDKLDTQIWLANTHGGMSMTDADGKLKTAELRRSDVDRMGAAVEELKDIIQNGRFEFNAEKKARSDQNKAIRQQVMDIVNGGKKGTPTSVQSARDKDASGKATPSKRTDNLLLPTQLFRQILKNSPLGDEWVQRLNKAQNDEADANIKFQHDAIQTLREKWGKNGKPASTLEVQKIISELSTTLKKTGIKIRPNNVYKVRTIDRGELDNYKGLITDREYNNLMRVLSDPDNSKIKRIDIHELTEESPEEELLLSPLQFVDALTAAEQPDSIQKVERNGLTPDVVAKIRDLVMKSKAKDVYDLAKQAYDNYDRINPVFRRLYGVDLPRVENYAPLTFDTSEPEKIIDMDDGQAGGASSQPSWTKSRGNFGGILRYDNAWAKLQNHMMNVNYWVSHAETLRDFRAIFGDTQVLRSIGSQNANHSDFLKNYMKVLSRDKQTTQNMSNQDMHLKKMFASVMSVATLGGSIPTAAKHINVGLAPLSEISPTQYILSALRVGTGLAPRNAFFGGNAMIKDKVVSRFADAAHSETGADALQAAREWSSPFMQGAALTGQQIAKMSMVPLHATVNVSAAWSGAVRYDAAFTEAQGLGMSDAEAHSYAQQQVDQMLHERMNPTFRGDKPISSWGKVGPDWMQLYAGPAQQALASVINLYRGAKIDSEGKSALEAAGIKADRYGKILATWAASGAVEWLVKTAYTMICGSDQQKEEAENWKELVASLATGPIYGVPIIGPFASGSLKAAITGHNPFYAAGNPLSDMARGGYHIYQHMKNDEMTGKDYADMVKDVSIVAAWSLSYAFQKDLLAKGLSGVAAWSNTGKAAAGAVQNANE